LLTRLGLRPRPSPAASVLAHTAALAVLALLAVPRVAGVFGPKAAEAIATLRRESATPVEAAVAVQGYYEEITDGHVRAGPWLASLEGRAKPPDAIHYREMTRDADDLLERELIPDWSGEVAGSRLTTNRFAMRDRPDRSQSKPPNTCRIALVGSSVVMGYGVGDDEPFPRLLEERLNARRRPDGPRYEVLNFGTGRSFVIQRHVLIDRKVLGFEPDAIYYVAHQDELLGPVRHLARLVGNGVRLPYPCLDEVVRKARIGPDTMGAEIEVLLQPFAREIVLGVYRDLVGVCRRRGILPVWVYLPMPGVVNAPPRTEELAKLAEEAGFEVVNLSDWADGHRPGEVKLGEGEHHPNRLGHQIIAGRLEAILAARPELLPAGARLRP
jgi:hypothetical protein